MFDIFTYDQVRFLGPLMRQPVVRLYAQRERRIGVPESGKCLALNSWEELVLLQSLDS